MQINDSGGIIIKERKSHCCSVVSSKPYTRSKDKWKGIIISAWYYNLIFFFGNLAIQCFNTNCWALLLCNDLSSTSQFFPISSSWRIVIESHTTRWWDNVTTWVNHFFPIFDSILVKDHSFGNFLGFIHFIFQHWFLFYPTLTAYLLKDRKKRIHSSITYFILPGVKDVKTQNGAAYITCIQAQWLLIDR